MDGSKMYEVDLAGREDLFHGICSLEKTADGVMPHRMTARLLDFYRRTNTDWFVRARGSSSGVRMEFRTAAKKLAMKIRFGDHCRFFYGFDIRCGDRPVGRFASRTMGEGVEFSQNLPGEGVRTVRIAFPWQSLCDIISFQLDDVSVIEPNTYPARPILFLGDSITQGYEAVAPDDAYVPRLALALGRDFFDLGVGGMVLRSDAVAHALDYPWSTAFLAFGVNDCSKRRELSVFREDVLRSLELLSGRADSKLYVITPLPWPGCPADQPEELSLSRYRAVLEECAAKFPSVTLFRGPELMDECPENYADKVHPNETGMARIACRLAERLPEPEGRRTL